MIDCLNEEKIQNKRKTFSNIEIQNGDETEIYCNNHIAKVLISLFKEDKILKDLYLNLKIVVFTPPDIAKYSVYDVLYSRTLPYFVSTYIIDGECVKNIKSNKQMINGDDIEEMKKSFSNIAIQTGKNIEIYCSNEEANQFRGVFGTNEKIHNLLLNGIIKILTPEEK